MLTQDESVRYNELKVKMTEVGHFSKLPKELQEEYTALNKKRKEDATSEQVPGKKEVTPETPLQDKVVLTRKEFDRLVAMVEDLQNKQKDTDDQLGFTAQNEWKKIQKDSQQFKTAKIRKYRKTTDDPWEHVIDIRHLRFDYDTETRRYNKDIQKLTLINTAKIDKNGKPEQRAIEADLQEIIRMKDFDLVKILESKTEDLVMVQGQVLKSEMDSDGYINPNRKTTQLVDLAVTRKHVTCTIELPSGVILKDIPAEKLNN